MTATVKICGIKQVETIQAILHLPIDHIGFVFAKSKRQATPQQAGEMIRALRGSGRTDAPLTFGVFVNPADWELENALREAPLDAVQLHGQESPDDCRRAKQRFGVKVYKAFSVTESAHAQPEQQLEPYRNVIDGLFLDTAGGGTGQPFDWNRIPAYAEWARKAGLPLIVAGGLQPDNVAELISRYAPDGVDVSSGVETDGQKDIAKITAFVERVKACV